jgi:uncharacterized membrane protein
VKEQGKDPHLLTRLEAFSDIVFGFVVAMMATHIKVPATPGELVLIRKDLVIFAFSFLLLCTLWLRHHRMMRRFFIPDVFGTVLTFAVLGTVALYSYPLQLYLRFPGNPIAVRSYAWGLAFLCMLYAVMAVYAVRKEGGGWPPAQQRGARRVIVANTIMAFLMIAFPLLSESFLLLVPLAASVLAFRGAKRWIDAPEREAALEPTETVRAL